MATDAQITANQANAQASTGPVTEAGKDRSSRNATTLGLFTRRDFVRPAEQEDYAELSSASRAELNPVGVLEDTLTAEIVSAAWRLRRCASLEARMAETSDLDPMEDEAAQRLQASVDRSRAQAHNLLRRSLAELRSLQTQRNMRIELFNGCAIVPDPDLRNYHEIARALANLELIRSRGSKRRMDDVLASLDAPLPDVPMPSDSDLGSICNPAREPAENTPAPTPRNAHCPCGSGVKYKRCCGTAAPPVLQRAA